LSDLAVSRNKGTWLTSIFERMGEDPQAPEYIKPAEGDVWEFIGDVKRWVSDQSRKGIPD
jgi:hypothetical protein